MAKRPGDFGGSVDVGFGIKDRTFGDTLPGQTMATRRGDPETAVIRRLSKFIPPDDALSFFVANEVDTVVIAVIDLISFQIPPSHIGVVNFLQVLSTNVDATFAGSGFSALINQTPIPGYEFIPIFQGGGSQANVPGDAFIRLKENETFAVRFAHAIAAAHHVGVQVRGYYWPLGSDEV